MFTDTEIASILSDFPKFELSYETMTHKKVFDYNVSLFISNYKYISNKFMIKNIL